MTFNPDDFEVEVGADGKMPWQMAYDQFVKHAEEHITGLTRMMHHAPSALREGSVTMGGAMACGHSVKIVLTWKEPGDEW